MLTYKRLEKICGVRKTYDFSHPRIVHSEEFKFPKGSAVIWFHKEYIGNPLFKKINGPTKTLILDKYFRQLPGKYMKRNVKLSSLITIAKKEDRDKDFDFVPSMGKALITPNNKLLLFDLYRLDTIYKYQKYRSAEYDKEMNILRTVVDATIEPDRVTPRKIFIPVPVPRSIPKWEEIQKALKYDTYKALDIVKNKDMLIILEILKMFSEKTKERSIFSKIKNLEYSDIVFIFGYTGKITLCSIENLFSLSKDNELSTLVKGVDSRKAMKIFLAYLLKISFERPKTMEELENDNSTDVSISDNEVNDIDILIDTHNKKTKEIEEKESKATKPNEKKLEEVIKEEESFEIIAKETLEEKENDGIVKETYIKKAIPLIEKNHKLMEELKPSKEEIELKKRSLPDIDTVLDKNMLETTITDFDKQYIEKVYKKQQKEMFVALGKSGYLLSKHEEEREVNISDDVEKHTITLLAPNGREITAKQIIPKVDSEGYMKLNTNRYKLRKMKADFPIKKVKPNIVALNSYYNKMFIKRGELNKNSQAASILRQLKKLSKEKQISMMVLGSAELTNIKLPILYTTMMRVVKSFIVKDIFFNFNYSKIDETFPDHNKKIGIVVGKDKKGKYYYLKDNDLISDKGESLGDFLVFIGIDKSKIAMEYATLNMLGDRIPLAIILMYYVGITNMFHTLNVKYRVVDVNERASIETDEYIIRFKDVKYIVKRDWTEVVVGALATIRELREGDFKSLDVKHTVRDIMLLMGYNRRIFIELDNLKALWVDPITRDILKLKGEPTTFIGLLYRAAELLKDDFFKPQNDNDGIVIKGYERLNGMLYHVMIKAIREQTQRQGLIASKLTVNPYEMMSMLSEDATFVLDNDMNPLNIMKQKEEVTLSGKFGRKKDSISMKDRVYDPSNFGIISEASKDSIDIGVTTYLSASPMINNVYGVLEDNDKDVTAANVFSSSALLMPGSTTDDGKRLLYISVQNAHIVPTKNQRSLPVRTGMESVIPYRVNTNYVMYATEKGKVVKVTDKEIRIRYKDKEQKYLLKEWTTKDVGGLAYKHKNITNLKTGDTVNEYDIIYYDSLFFEIDIFNPKRVVYKVGETALVALDESEETYEDSCAVSSKFSKQFTTKITKVNGKVFDKDIKIKTLLDLNTKVSYNDVVFSYVLTTEDDYTDTVFKKSQEKIEDLRSNNVYAEAKGLLYRYEIYYRCELSEMSDELQEIVKKSDKIMKELYRHTGKVTNTFSVKGKPLAESELYIKFFIEKEKELTVGDKIIVGNQLKNTVGDIFDKIVTEDGREIDVRISKRSVSARIVNSPEDIGTTNLVLQELNRRFVEGDF